MAIEESDREDLMREAIRYRDRVLLTSKSWGENVELFAGRRVNGEVSVYWTSEEVFQFNSAGELRRLFYYNKRYAAENRKLVELLRESRGGRVHWERVAIAEEDWLVVCRAWQERVTQVCSSLARLNVRIEQSIPDSNEVPEWFINHFQRVTILQVALSSHVANLG